MKAVRCLGWSWGQVEDRRRQPDSGQFLPCPGPSLHPIFVYALFFSLLEGKDQGSQSPETRTCSGDNCPWGEGVAEKQRGGRPTEQGQDGDKRDRVVPSHLALVMPHASHGAPPKVRSFLQGSEGKSHHWPGSWHKGRKGSSGKGARSRSTPCSRSMQHCGGSMSQAGASPSPSHFLQRPCTLLSCSQSPGPLSGRHPLISHLGTSEPLRKQR